VAGGLQDLVTNNVDGFIQELELIPPAVISLSLFTGLIPLLGLADLVAGVPLSL
jgi:hypothetical protein